MRALGDKEQSQEGKFFERINTLYRVLIEEMTEK
tara:strand:- start:1329 stop:1430 length:102 start_codon:yes stop_codon:yes gene_type:complete